MAEKARQAGEKITETTKRAAEAIKEKVSEIGEGLGRAGDEETVSWILKH